MALKKAKNTDWQDGVCVPRKRRKVLLVRPSEPCQRSYFFRRP
jgi:hypothetical protein